MSLLLTVLPGPDTLLVVRSGLRGRRQAIAVGLGTAVAAFGWGLAAAFGVAALLQHSAAAFTAVKLAGAAYLVFLGVRTFWRTRQGQVSAVPTGAEGHHNAWRAARTGLVAGLLNPKTGLFYVAVLPQIIPETETVLPSTLLFATVDAVVVALYFVLLAWFAALLTNWLRRPRTLRFMERTTAVALMMLGIRTALEP
ncbi:LysE family translocator [Kitasatospora purpeofusca]|uniref:LysE family translocator n=1 Tax=Kitasatospora purpeofusca TaxID=67352 RepID=UPI0035E2F789